MSFLTGLVVGVVGHWAYEHQDEVYEWYLVVKNWNK